MSFQNAIVERGAENTATVTPIANTIQGATAALTSAFSPDKAVVGLAKYIQLFAAFEAGDIYATTKLTGQFGSTLVNQVRGMVMS